MRFAFTLVTLLALAARAEAQAPRPVARIVGDRIGSRWTMEDRSTRTVADTITLTFLGRDGDPVYRVDFITRHPLAEPVPASAMVDIIVSQHPVEDDTPDMTLRVDGNAVAIVARPHGSRSVAATVSLAEFDRIAGAELIVDRTFDTELEFGAGQVRMLRTMADRWLGRAR